MIVLSSCYITAAFFLQVFVRFCLIVFLMLNDNFLSNLTYILYSVDSPVSLFFSFVFGAFIGSFLNVCIYRIPLCRSIVLPSSSCFSCGEPVKWYFNLPVVGYLLLRGRCHDCGSRFSGRYAMLEFLAGCASLLLFRNYGGFSLSYFYYFFFFCVLTVVFFIDLDHWLILDSIIFPSCLFGLAAGLFIPAKASSAGWIFLFVDHVPMLNNNYALSAVDSMAAGLIGFAVFALIAFYGSFIFRQEAMGGGDIKFALLIGIFLGLEKAGAAFFFSFFAGILFMIPFMAVNKKSGREPVPFGTFMSVGSIAALFFADSFWNWLIGLSGM